MQSPSVVEIERQIRSLSAADQCWLVDKISESLRAKAEEARHHAEVAAMAADPQIQSEIYQIQKEFAAAEADGLEGL